MSKERSGELSWTLCRDEGEIEVDVAWTYECSEYGDGSDDEQFFVSATDFAGNCVSFTDDEETKLKEQLENWGEFE